MTGVHGPSYAKYNIPQRSVQDSMEVPLGAALFIHRGFLWCVNGEGVVRMGCRYGK